MVLGSSSGKERFAAATSLLDYGFAHYENSAAELPADAPQTLPVTHGTAPEVGLAYTAPGRYLTPKGEGGALQAILDLPETLASPVAAGDTVGAVKILKNGVEVETYPITAAQNVDALSFGYCFAKLAESLLLKN